MRLSYLILLFRYLNDNLSEKSPKTGSYVRIGHSDTVKDEYGLFAKRNIPRGTMIGYYQGELVPFKQGKIYNDYTMKIAGSNILIDASGFLSCFGRYMNSAVRAVYQNVSFEVVASRSSNNQVIMVTVCDVKKDSELLTNYGSAYWQDKYNRLPEHDGQGRRLCTTMLDSAKRDAKAIQKINDYIKQEEAQRLKDNFGIDHDASDGEEEVDDDEYIDSNSSKKRRKG